MEQIVFASPQKITAFLHRHFSRVTFVEILIAGPYSMAELYLTSNQFHLSKVQKICLLGDQSVAPLHPSSYNRFTYFIKSKQF